MGVCLCVHVPVLEYRPSELSAPSTVSPSMYHEFKKYLLHEKTNKPFLYDSLGAQRQTEFTEWLIGMRNGDLVRGDEGEAENKVNIYWVLLVARCWKSFHI